MTETSLFSEEYGKTREVLRVKERTKSGYEGGVPERLLRCVWYEQLFLADGLKTLDGRSVTILSPGRWNLESGPDFRNAAVSFGEDRIVAGDIEIDPTVSDWHGHGHDSDPDYTSVTLLVVLDAPGRQASPKNARNKNVPVLVLRDYLRETIEQLSARLDPREYPFGKSANLGACAHADNLDRLCRIIDMAADWRVISKAKQFSKDIEAKGLDQAFYEGFMTALGYKKFKDQFRQVAMREHIAHLQKAVARSDGAERAELAEALLLNAADLIPDDPMALDWDEESRAYYHRLRTLLDENSARTGVSPTNPIVWHIGGVRPANFPMRRLVGAARVISSCLTPGIARRCLDLWTQTTGTNKDAMLFSTLFMESPESYWTYRFTWGGKRATKPTRLIGKGRAAQIVVNVIIPFSLAVARGEHNLSFEQNIFATYISCPPLPSDAVLRLMMHRLFGPEEPAPSLIRNARRQQGLIQIYQDWCADDPICRQCSILPLVTA